VGHVPSIQGRFWRFGQASGRSLTHGLTPRLRLRRKLALTHSRSCTAAHLGRPDASTAAPLGWIQIGLAIEDAILSAVELLSHRWAVAIGHTSARSSADPLLAPVITAEVPEPPSKPGSVPPTSQPAAAHIPLGRALPRVSSELYPEAPTGPVFDPRSRAGHALAGDASLFALAPGGVCLAAPVTRRAVRSYRTVSPLPRLPHGSVRRSVLCGTVLRIAPTGRWPAPCPVVPGLSSATPCPAGRRVRPGGSGGTDLTPPGAKSQRRYAAPLPEPLPLARGDRGRDAGHADAE